MTGSSSVSTTMFIALLLITCYALEIAAKRGCSSFGHSCYGGHGKRSSYPEALEFDVVRNDNDLEMNYDPDRSNAWNLALLPSQDYERHAQNTLNSMYEQALSWSIFIRKLERLFD
ncbi:PREDICTED: uncharacterized protein LOC105362725 [Ceratosolen solmsi marchali]|uniref:Uncharacterized protein LOC105362725 n=1 Tax=Ceratosolen solmsi marchali TaxID=326594 RepID=A0AAJ6YI47_9HYME|nr:PREDICTED: uncharacterized protein LOC105362725 [Ceratosolen solmsi marchali]